MGTTALAQRTDLAKGAQLQRDERLVTLLNALETGVDPPPMVPDDIRANLPALIADMESQLLPLSGDDMQAELTAIVAAMGMGAPQTEKTEFMATAMIVLEKYPAALCREALHEALSAVDSLRKVLSFVADYCEDYPEKMRRRLSRLLDLHNYAEGRRDV